MAVLAGCLLASSRAWVVRLGLTALINTESDMEVVAEAADGQQAIELFHQHQPDLALLDMRMPVKTGVQATDEIRAKFPQAPIIMLTA